MLWCVSKVEAAKGACLRGAPPPAAPIELTPGGFPGAESLQNPLESLTSTPATPLIIGIPRAPQLAVPTSVILRRDFFLPCMFIFQSRYTSNTSLWLARVTTLTTTIRLRRSRRCLRPRRIPTWRIIGQTTTATTVVTALQHPTLLSSPMPERATSRPLRRPKPPRMAQTTPLTTSRSQSATLASCKVAASCLYMRNGTRCPFGCARLCSRSYFQR